MRISSSPTLSQSSYPKGKGSPYRTQAPSSLPLPSVKFFGPFLLYLLDAKKLDEMLEKKGVKVDKVLNFSIDDAILEEHITGRWIHPSSGRTYHTKFAPPKVPGVDDVTVEPLIQRKDDKAAVLKSRLVAFHKQTEPVIDYYSKKGIVANLAAKKPPKKVTAEVEKAA